MIINVSTAGLPPSNDDAPNPVIEVCTTPSGSAELFSKVAVTTASPALTATRNSNALSEWSM